MRSLLYWIREDNQENMGSNEESNGSVYFLHKVRIQLLRRNLENLSMESNEMIFKGGG